MNYFHVSKGLQGTHRDHKHLQSLANHLNQATQVNFMIIPYLVTIPHS